MKRSRAAQLFAKEIPMADDLTERVDALEAHFEKSMGQLSKLVEFLNNLAAAMAQLTASWTEERTVTNAALNGHKEGIEQLARAQTQIASAIDNLSRQCGTMFKLQNDRIAALEQAKQVPASQQLN